MLVAVPEVKPGSVLAAPAVGPGGRQLAPVGSVLTAQHIIVLRAWGIAKVEIADDQEAADKQARLAAQRIVAARFRGQPTDHPAVRALFAAAVVRLIKGGA
jgi:hypothetical protein